MIIPIRNLTENNSINLSVVLGNRKIDNTVSSCCLDCSTLGETTPSGVLLATSVIKKFQKINPDLKINFKVDKENSNVNLAGNLGLFREITSQNIDYGKKFENITKNDIFIPITKLNFYNYTKSWTYSHMSPTQYIEFQANNIARTLSDDVNIQKVLIFMITEIIRNTEEHANVDNVWISAQSSKTKKYIEIAILDNGEGYKSVLKKSLNNKLLTDEDAVKLALMPGVPDYNTNLEDGEGFGLYVVSEICNHLNGGFTIVSGNSALVKRKDSTVTKEANHKGSFIKLLIDTTVAFNFNSLVGEIFEKGKRMQLK